MAVTVFPAAHADLLRRLGRDEEAVAADDTFLQLLVPMATGRSGQAGSGERQAP
jgi:predicted RNA polymerase sigma factor